MTFIQNQHIWVAYVYICENAHTIYMYHASSISLHNVKISSLMQTFFIQEYKIHFKSHKDIILYCIQYFRNYLPGEKGKELYLYVNFIFKITITNMNNINIYQHNIYSHTYLLIF